MWEISGFAGDNTDVSPAMEKLQRHISELPALIKKYSSTDFLKPLAPGKWSRQQVLGHLVDSALNNLRRFTEIQFTSQPYTITPYNQDKLVEVNHYQDMQLDELIALWQAVNRQILWVVNKIPAKKLNNPVAPGYADGEMRTLEWVIVDYVAHLEHHLAQLEVGSG